MNVASRGSRQPQVESQDAGTIPPEDVGEEDVEEREARVEDRVAHDAVPQVVAESFRFCDRCPWRRRRGRDRRDRRDGHGHGDFERVSGFEIGRDGDVHELAVDVVLDRVAGRPARPAIDASPSRDVFTATASARWRGG